MSLLIYAKETTFPVNTKNTVPAEAKPTGWNPNKLLSLIIATKNKTEFMKFKTTTKVLNDLLSNRIIWVTEITKKSPKNEPGYIRERLIPLLPFVKVSKLKNPRIIWVMRRISKMSFNFILTSFFWLWASFNTSGDTSKTTIRRIK